MAEHNCKTCKFRKKYDTNPSSILGRLWRWHINWCPGWRRYMADQPAAEKELLRHKYELKC